MRVPPNPKRAKGCADMVIKRLDRTINLIPKDYGVILAEGSTEPVTTSDTEEVTGEGFNGQEWWEDPTFKGYDVNEDPDDYTFYDISYNIQKEDYEIVEDVKSVLAGVILKMLTIYGELDYPPYEDWGDRLWEIIYEANTPITISKAEGYMVEAIEEMDRVKSVDHVQIDRVEDKLYISVQITTVDDNTVETTLEIGAD